jgi:uncharacterized ion transporter superfamily protein YfcC
MKRSTPIMNDFLIIFAIAAAAAFLTWLGAPPAGRFDVPQRVVSVALQFVAGLSLYAIITLTVK